jgi:tol-pal system beta propeller repeat protein TolB
MSQALVKPVFCHQELSRVSPNLTLCCWLAIVACPPTFLSAGDEPAESLPVLTVASNRLGKIFEPVTLDVAGRNAVFVLPDRAGAADPHWSADGRKLLYSCGKSGLLQIYRYDVDRGEEVNLTKSAANEHQPSWSPDGKRVLFTSQRTGNHEIFVMNDDGTNAVNLTNNPGFDSDPAWAPDGKQIAFGSSRLGGGFRLFVMNADGSNPRDLLQRSLGGWISPSWSPDGKQILFAGKRDDGSWQISVVNADGTAAEVLTNGPGYNSFPSWSPDGRYIAYVHFDHPIEKSPEGGTLMLYDLDTLAHTPIAPEGMRCGGSRIAWKPK